MNGLEVPEPSVRLALRRSVAAWSDGIESKVVRLVEEKRDLLPRRITNAQLSGLENVVGQASTYREIQAFLDNRADRANRAGRLDVATYWNTLSEVLSALKTEAENVGMAMFADLTDRQRKIAVDEFHVRLVREYAQHLVAHSLYVGGETGRKPD
jgi:hypothetical protein